MDPARKAALAAGVLYLVGFVSIPDLVSLQRGALGELRRRHRPGHSRVHWGVSWRW